MSIYTKKGDSGLTDTLSGNRVNKNDPLIQLLGCVDELSTYLGNAKLLLEDSEQREISEIQQKLIQIMGSISSGFEKNITLVNDCKDFEERIDEFSKMFPPLQGFVLPGECEAASRMDLARIVARRAERELVAMKSRYRIPTDYYSYFNRLSDYLFAWARRLEFRDKILRFIHEETGHGGLPLKNLQEKKEINRNLAREIAEEVVKKAMEIGAQIVVSIVNKDGNPILIDKMDGAFLVSFDLARKKAFTSAALKMPTHELAKLTSKGADFFGLENMLNEEIVTLGGGFPIMYQKEILGAIGVSGSTVENDMELARFGSMSLERNHNE